MLTERQRRFVEAYQGNGLEAARVAGYTGTDNALMVTASRLLKHPAVIEALEHRQAAVFAAADVPEDPPLDPKQRAFVDAYLATGNASAAARAAGYSVKSAGQKAQELLARADVHEAIERGRARREAAAIASVREMQEILTKLARDEAVFPKDRIAAIDKLFKIQRASASRTPATGAGASPGDGSARPRIVIVHNGRGPAPSAEAADG